MSEFFELVGPDRVLTAMVSGGRDAGWAGATTTIVCNTCRVLYNAVICWPRDCIDVEPQCPNASEHPIAVWTFPGACPERGAQMQDRHCSHRMINSAKSGNASAAPVHHQLKQAGDERQPCTRIEHN